MTLKEIGKNLSSGFIAEGGVGGHIYLKTLFTETYEEAVELAKEYKGPKPF